MDNRSVDNESRLATALRYAVSVIVSYDVDAQSLPVKYRKPFISPLYQRVWDDILVLLDGAVPYTEKPTIESIKREIMKLREAGQAIG